MRTIDRGKASFICSEAYPRELGLLSLNNTFACCQDGLSTSARQPAGPFPKLDMPDSSSST